MLYFVVATILNFRPTQKFKCTSRSGNLLLQALIEGKKSYFFLYFFGKTINGSTRWIDLVAFRLQPSEILKIVIILFTAGFLVEQEKDLKRDERETTPAKF